MGQPAYDMSSEVRRRKAPQTQRKVALRVEKGGKRRLSRSRRHAARASTDLDGAAAGLR